MDFEIDPHDPDPDSVIAHIMDSTGRSYREVAPGVLMAMRPIPESAIEAVAQETGQTPGDVRASIGPSVLKIMSLEEEASMNRYLANLPERRKHATEN